MKRHIDADKLKTEINKAFGNLSKYNKESFADSPYTQGHLIGQKQAIEHILFIIDSLQQEQPIKVNTLTWKDINDLERIINNVHYEFRNGIGEKSFGEEVLERFREERDEQEQPEDIVVIAKTFLDALTKTPYNNKPITDAQIIVKQLLLFFENPKEYNPDAILEQPEGGCSEIPNDLLNARKEE